jgi:hypothetical protein
MISWLCGELNNNVSSEVNTSDISGTSLVLAVTSVSPPLDLDMDQHCLALLSIRASIPIPDQRRVRPSIIRHHTPH